MGHCQFLTTKKAIKFKDISVIFNSLLKIRFDELSASPKIERYGNIINVHHIWNSSSIYGCWRSTVV